MNKRGQRNKPSGRLRNSRAREKSRTLDDASPRAIMVLGMHRSGTSALTRILSLLGADLPANLAPPSETNKTGYWESYDLMEIHDQVLKSAGSDWYDWRRFNQEWFSSPLAPIYRQQIIEVLRRDFSQSRLFVIKDPRICRLWPLWRDALEEFGAKPSVVMPIRNPLEVATSLKRRNELIPADIYLVWLRHVLDAEAATRGLPRAIVTYDSLLDDWQETIAAVSSKLQLSWPRRGPLAEIEIEKFLSPQLKHYTKTIDRLADKADVVDWVKDAYAILTHMTESADNPFDMARLDNIRAAFDKASAAFAIAAVEAAKGAVEDRDRLRAELDIVQPALDELLQLKEQFAATEQALAKARAETAAAREEALCEHEAAAARQAEIDKVGGELTSACAVVKDRDGAIVRLMHDLDAARGYLRESQTQVQQLAGELDSARTELKRGETEQLRLEKIVADGTAEIKTARLRIETLQGERDGLQATAGQLPVLRAQVEALKQALADARNEADRRERAIAESAVRLAEATSDKSRLAEKLEHARDAARRGEQSATDRIAAIEALRAAALAESDNKAQARIRALKDQLIDAEAALAKYKNGRSNGASWTRHLSVARLRALREIVNSGLFDAEWYLHEYPDVASSGRSPAEHYLDEGYLHGYRPNPLFDTRWYLERYEDVRRAGVNPLLHYVHNGAREGRDPGPDFHTDFYLVSNPDVRKSGMNPLSHYLRHGRNEGRAATRQPGSD